MTSIPSFASAADAWQQLDRHMATGLYSNGFVDTEPADRPIQPQDPSPAWGR